MSTNDQLIITEAAAMKVKRLIEEEGNPELRLRVFTSGSGSSGLRYGFTFDEDIKEGDTEIENEGAKLLIDSISYQYLIGAEIDYIKGKFTIQGPDNEPPPPLNYSVAQG